MAVPSSASQVPNSAERCSVAELLQTAAELFANEQYESSGAVLRYVLGFRCRSPELWLWLATILDAQGESEQAAWVRQISGHFERGRV
jgi:hypothetical protein